MALSDLIAKGKSFLTRRKPPLECVRRQAMDDIVYADVCQQTPVLTTMADELNMDHAYTGELTQDVWQLFYKALPEIHDRDAVDPRVLINHSVVTGIDRDPTTPNTRELTRGDRYGATLATLSVQERIESDLTRSKEAEEVRDASQRAADAAAREQQAASDASAAAEGLEAAGAPEGMGPLTEQQQALLEQLVEALGEQEQAAADASDARADVERAVTSLETRVRPGVRAGLQEAEGKLEAERALISAWGLDEGKLQRLSFAERQAYMSKLQRSKLGRYAELLGRYRMRARAERVRKVRHGRDEVYDTTLGNDLPDVLPSEFVKLAHRATRLMFLRDFAEGNLLSRKWRGTERQGQGPVVCLVDCSNSMTVSDRHGIPREMWAKAFALSMLDQAHAAKRDFVAINFAGRTEQQVWRFPGNQPMDVDAVLEWTEHFFNGGTWYQTPIDHAVKIIGEQYDTEAKGRADLLLITDDECRVTSDWLAKYQRAKKYLAFRCYGIAVGGAGEGAMTAICDDIRSIEDFSDPSVVADIYQNV